MQFEKYSVLQLSSECEPPTFSTLETGLKERVTFFSIRCPSVSDLINSFGTPITY